MLVKRIKLRLARELRILAQRLDARPEVSPAPSGGWTISFKGVRLATISAGDVQDTRPPREWA